MTLRYRNYPLFIGALLSLFFIFLVIWGPSIAPLDPLVVFNSAIFIGDKTYIPSVSPLQPFELPQFRLGTDNAGRDLLSRLLFAIRPTFALCLSIVTVRVLAGLILGLVSGWFRGTAERVIDTLISVSLAVPLLLFGLAALSFMGHRELPQFILALSLTGWANTAVFVKNRTLTIMQAPFIEGAKAVGVKPFGILRRHILPQLWPALPSQIAFELSAVLLVVGELGFLGMFIGEGFVVMAADPNSSGTIPVGLTSSVPELGQMLSDFWSKMIRTPWEIAIVGAVIFLQIFAFNLLGEGLRRHMDVTLPRPAWWRRLISRPVHQPQVEIL